MKPVVTIQKIASYLGVSKGTVSLALRNHTRISAETRARVRAAAEHLGYRPNPVVAAWMAHRRRANPDQQGASMAFLNLWPDLEEWNRSPWFTRFVNGARQRALDLGFGFEEYWLAEPGMTAKRMSGILKARGIQGIIVGSLTENGTSPALDWENFAAVAQSHSLTEPELSRSVCDYSHAMALTLSELCARGYRRIGYASPATVEERTQGLNIGAYLRYQNGVPVECRVPVLDWTNGSIDHLNQWLKTCLPDALVSHDLFLLERIRQLGYHVPDDIGVAVLCLHPDSPWELAGIDQGLERCGEVAVDLLTSRLHSNELGPPSRPIIAQSRGTWRNGSSVRSFVPLPRERTTSAPE